MLVARYGVEFGNDVCADALAYAWEHWARVEPMDNPVGSALVVARTWEVDSSEALELAVSLQSSSDDARDGTVRDAGPFAVVSVPSISTRWVNVVGGRTVFSPATPEEVWVEHALEQGTAFMARSGGAVSILVPGAEDLCVGIWSPPILNPNPER